MAESPVLMDVTELVAHPMSTGIQRVEREIMRHWPGHAPLALCRFDAPSRKFVKVPDAVLKVLVPDTVEGGMTAMESLVPHLATREPLSDDELAIGLFNPEVFYDPLRAAAYHAVCKRPGAQVSWLLYDFLPFLRPQDYPSGTTKHCMPYVQALRTVPRVSAISELTRIEYTTRIMRDPERTGPHFPLGGDGLQLEKQTFRADKKTFAYLGTIEPRKNVAVILEGFERLWARDVDVDLVVIGRIDSRSTREIPILKRLEQQPRFKYLGHVGDATVREAMRGVRATLFISAVEGFGIPPYESLRAGIPAIVSPGLPSTELLSKGGRITLKEISPTEVEQAVMHLLDDGVAARLWNEASRLPIPTWKDFAGNIAAWLQERHVH